MEEDPTTLAFTRSARKRTLGRGRDEERGENGEKEGERGVYQIMAVTNVKKVISVEYMYKENIKKSNRQNANILM